MKKWHAHIDELKKHLDFERALGLSQRHAFIWAKAERLLKHFGVVSKDAERRATHEVITSLRNRRPIMDINRFSAWKEYVRGSLIVKVSGQSNPVFRERHVQIFYSRKLVFSVEYHCHSQGEPHCAVSAYMPGPWEGDLSTIWNEHCEALRKNKQAMMLHGGSVSAKIFSKCLISM
jgi:hypothetical protein